MWSARVMGSCLVSVNGLDLFLLGGNGNIIIVLQQHCQHQTCHFHQRTDQDILIQIITFFGNKIIKK